MSESDKLFQLVNTAQNILILSKGDLTILDIDHLVNLKSYIESFGKTIQFVNINEKPSKESIKYAKEKNISIESDIKPAEYVVSIDYGTSGVEKVVYDTDAQSGKLIFKIHPSRSGFSFDKVQFIEGNSSIDGLITINIQTPSELGSFYDNNEYLFKEIEGLNLETFSQLTSLITFSQQPISKELADSLLTNIVKSSTLIEGNTSVDNLKQIARLIDLDGDIWKAMKETYYSKPKQYLDVLKSMANNTYMNGNILYSYLMKTDIKDIDITVLTKGLRLPFNVVKDIDLAFLFIENTDGKVIMVVQSNDVDKHSASTIAGVFGGSGDSGHAFATLDDMSMSEVNSRFAQVVRDLYNFGNSFNFDNIIVDNLPKVLTKGRKNSKNKGSK